MGCPVTSDLAGGIPNFLDNFFILNHNHIFEAGAAVVIVIKGPGAATNHGNDERVRGSARVGSDVAAYRKKVSSVSFAPFLVYVSNSC